MSRTRIPITPPIYTEGIFVCFSPFELEAKVFRCEAIRTFPELERRGINVFETYYKPKNLDAKIWEEDAKIKASILTLKSVDGDIVYVPNTFLESYPGMSGIVYSHNVIVLDVGMVPATVDIDRISADIADMVKTLLGVKVDVRVDSLRVEENITHDKHVQLETARRVAISKHIPLQERLDEMTIERDKLREKNNELISIIAGRS